MASGGAVTVGGLVINLAAETSQLKVGMAEGVRTVDSGAKAMINSMTGITESSGRATDAGQRLVKQLQEEIATFGMTSQQLTQHKANLNGVGGEVEALTQRLNAMRSAQSSFAQDLNTSSTALRAHGAEARAAGGHVEEFGFRTASSKRELLVLAHELSQGNYKKFGGSMLVLAEQTGAAGALFSAAGLSAIALGAAVVAVSAALIHGVEDQRAMSNALIETGNYAGATSDSLNALAHQAVVTGGSLGEAKKAVTALAGSGKFTSEQIGYITDAAVAMEHATGKAIDKTIEEFQSLAVETTGNSMRSSEAISKATVKLDEQYHFLTESVYEQIRALEKEGNQKAASALATETLARVTKERAEEMKGNIGSIQHAWQSLKEVISEVGDNIGNIGKRATAATDVSKAALRLKQFDEGLGAIGMTPSQLTGSWAETRKKLTVELTSAQEKLNQVNAVAEAQGKARVAQSDAVLAASRIDQDNMRLGRKTVSELDDALQKYAQDRAKIAAVNKDSPLLDPDEVNKHIALITKAHTEKKRASTGQDDRAAVLQDALTVEQTALDREKSIYDSREKMLDLYHAKFGTSDAEFYAGRAAARADYIAAEAITFAKESALVQAAQAQGRNPQEVAAAKEKYDQLLRAHEKFVDDMRNAGGQDAATAEASQEKQYRDIVKASHDAGVAAIASLDEQILKQREHNAEIGKTKEQVELAKQAQINLDTTQKQSDAEYLRAGLAKWDLDEKSRAVFEGRLNDLDEEIARRRTIAGLFADGADAEAGSKAAKDLDKYLDPTKADAFGKSLKGAIGGAAESMNKLIKAMQSYGVEQARNDKARAEAEVAVKNKTITQEQYLDDLDKINKRNTQNQMAGYGNLASAAAGFFGEHSRGYQALTAVSQVFHAAELAMTTAELVPKAISAVLSQGQGDPYTAFGRMAAMAAIVAGLGVAIGGVGGGADTTAADRQKSQGTGSVLGDSDAKSDSIKKSLDLVEKNTYQGLAISSSMLASLRSIESSVSSFASQLVSSTDIANPSIGVNTNNGGATTATGLGLTAGTTAVGYMAGAGLSAFTAAGAVGGPVGMLAGAVLGYLASKSSFVGKIATSIFGGKQTVQDSGFSLDAASLEAITTAGAKAYKYADITTSGGWFRKDKTSTQSTDLDDAANQQFTAIITSMADSIKAAGSVLGLSGDDFTAKLNSFVIDIGKISLKGLSGDEIQKALESVFSKLGDDMAQFAVGGLQQFQAVGEGYLETLARIASEYQAVDVVFASFGKTFDLVGLSSIEARDRLVQMAGGLDKFTSQGEYFLENFFSEQEQAEALKNRITPTLAQYGLSAEGEGAMKAFRDLVVGLDTTTEAGAQAYSTLMTVAPALKTITDAEKDALDERKSLQDKLDELTMTAAQLHEKERSAVDASNLALYDRVAALQAEKDAVTAAAAALQATKDAASTLLGGVDSMMSVLQKVATREKAAVQTVIDAHTTAVTRLQGLSEALHSALDSYKSAEQETAARGAAQAEIRADLAITKAGGSLSDAQIDSLKKALGVATKDAASQFSSYSDYLRDMYQTQVDIGQLADVTDDSLSIEQQALNAAKDQLEAIDKMVASAQDQVDILKGVDANGITLVQAMQALTSAMLAAKANPIVGVTSAISGAYQQYLGRTPDAEGLEWWQNAAATGTSVTDIVSGIANSTEATLKTLYQQLLGRAPDAQGLAFWGNAYGTTMDEAEKADFMSAVKGSVEYKTLHPFAVGTNYIPEDMPAMVHKGERIIPAADNRALFAALASPAGNADALAAAVDRLTATVATQQATIAQQSEDIKQARRDTKRMADTLERVTRGGNKMVTTTEAS